MALAPSVVPVSRVPLPPPPPPVLVVAAGRRRARPSARRSRTAPRRVDSSHCEPLLLRRSPTVFGHAPVPLTDHHQLPRGPVEPRSTISSGIRRLSTASPASARSSRSAPRRRSPPAAARRWSSPGVAARLDVVEADDRQLLGHRHARRLRRLEHPDRLDVGRREDGGRPVLARRAARPPRRGAASRPWRPAHDPLRRESGPGGRGPPRSPRAGGRWSRSRTGSPPRRPGRRCRGGRAPSRCSAAIRPPSTSSIVIDGSVGCSRSSSTIGTPTGSQPPRLALGGRERDREQAVDAAADRERAERSRRCSGALDVEQDQLVALARRACARRRAAARSPTAG